MYKHPTNPTHHVTVEFAMSGTDQTVTVNSLPIIWKRENFGNDLEHASILKGIQYLRSLGVIGGLDTICVVTSPVKSVEELQMADAKHIARLVINGEPLSSAAAGLGYTPTEARNMLDLLPS